MTGLALCYAASAPARFERAAIPARRKRRKWKIFQEWLQGDCFSLAAWFGLQSLKLSMGCGVKGKCLRTADLRVLVAAVQAVVVAVAAPALLDAALVAALELLRLAQLGQHLSLFNWGKHPQEHLFICLVQPECNNAPT